ncbi:hypothetical protein K2Y34_17050 [Cronobacter sakazakii]|uniref:hypothetical protein n=1 Tax=Cronobacter sakazakii TaxID=28141 RepID=UPI0021B66077|nr:hypothetical protein [Cronobacter sakazakii]UXD90742.1 hypothetical protein K2Y34_17050 [Cronobacter sakazakii]
MNPHDRLNIVLVQARQFWRAFAYDMHLHENRPMKRAGEAGIALRAAGCARFKITRASASL